MFNIFMINWVVFDYYTYGFVKDGGFKLRAINCKAKFIEISLNMPFAHMSWYGSES